MQVLSGDDGEGVGRIRKLWGGQAKEQYTDADSFEIQCKLIMISIPCAYSCLNNYYYVNANWCVYYAQFQRISL